MTEEGKDEEDEEEEPPSWGALLRPVAVEPSQEGAQFLCQVLSAPPPLDQLRASEKSLPCYKHVPQTPPPRGKNRVDSALFNAQKKMEQAMHLLVHNIETGDRETLSLSAAWIRSIWEDIQQQRRHLLAGKQSFKLDPMLWESANGERVFVKHGGRETSSCVLSLWIPPCCSLLLFLHWI